MNRLFGSSKSNAVPKPNLNDTVATLDSRVETINKQIAAVDQELQAYNKLPPSRKASQKSRALALLSKKKMYEKQRATIEGQASNIGATAFAISNLQTQKEVYDGLKSAKQQLAKGNQEINLNRVETLMDDLDDELLEQNEMNDVFSRPIGQDAYTTDADLEAELAGLAESELYGDLNPMVDLRAPSVPVQPIVAPTSTTRNDVAVDDYGLPKFPTAGMRN